MRASRAVAPLPLRHLPGPARPGDELAKHGLESRVVTVTPALAKEWLELNTRNRNPKSKKNGYARDMGVGTWGLTGQAIIFGSDGILLDGQNRLMGCIESGATFMTVVIWGVDPEQFRHMDRGATRTVGDALGIDGEANSVVLAAVLSMLYRELNSISARGGSTSPTLDEQYDILNRYPDVRLSLRWQGVPHAFAVTPTTAVFMHYKFSRLDRELADSFFAALYSEDGYRAGHPIQTLKRTLTSYRIELKGSSPNVTRSMALIIRGWNAWVEGRTATKLAWIPTMDFPKIVDPKTVPGLSRRK